MGVGTLEELQSDLKGGLPSDKRAFPPDKGGQGGSIQISMIDRERLIGQAKKPLEALKRLSDLNIGEVKQSQEISKEIKSSLKDTEALCDIVIFNRITDKANRVSGFKLEEWTKNLKSIRQSKELKSAREELKGLQVLHFPIAFPEVFLRERPGFDVIIGNPPWEKVKLEEHAFWAVRFPGLRGLSPREREAEMQEARKQYPHLVKEYERELSTVKRLSNILTSSSVSETGSGDSDLYKFFCWRFWNLICKRGGFLGVVLKGSVCQSEGSEHFRKEIFKKSRTHITAFVNNSGWAFKGVAGFPIIILSLEKNNQTGTSLEIQEKNHSDSHTQRHNAPGLSRQNKKTISIQGPFRSLKEFQIGKTKPPLFFTESDIQSWTDSASLPSLPREDSLDVFLQLRKFPRLDLNDGNPWRARPDTELHATKAKKKLLIDLKSKECPKGFWPVFTGKSFDIWMPDTGKYYAYADPKKVTKWLYKKRLNGHKNRRSPHSEFSITVRDKSALSCFKPRIAFRDVCSSEAERTVCVSLLPPKCFVVHKAPYFLFPRGDEKDEAFLLGILSSIPLDWYARRFISTNSLGFFLLNTFPVPRPSRTNPLWKRAVALSGRLASPDKRFAEWAKAVGAGCGPLDEKRKTDMIYELDAVSAHLYGLSQKQLIHIFETFHRTWDYAPRLQAVLKHYNFWKKEYKNTS